RVIQSTLSLLQKGVDLSLDAVAVEDMHSPAPQNMNVAAALNGVCGDHLEASNNPLAINMHFRNSRGEIVQSDPEHIRARLPGASSRLVVLVHGLCLSHDYWNGHNE